MEGGYFKWESDQGLLFTTTNCIRDGRLWLKQFIKNGHGAPSNKSIINIFHTLHAKITKFAEAKSF